MALAGEGGGLKYRKGPEHTVHVFFFSREGVLLKETMIMENCVIGIAVTRVFFTTRVHILDSEFPFSFSPSLMNCWNLWKRGVSLFRSQLSSPETDLNNYVPIEGVLCSQQWGERLKPVHSGTIPSTRRQFFFT